MNRKHYTNIQVVAKKPSGGSRNPKGPKPPRITTNDLANKLNDVMVEIKAIHTRLDKVDARLDKHEAMFKQHGWMK